MGLGCLLVVLGSARMQAQPGGLDPTFQFATTTVFPSALATQSDGKVLIGGGFSQVNGEGRNTMARLNADGSLDTTFVVGLGAQVVTDAITLPGGIVLLPASTVPGVVNSVDVQADGKIVIVGNFNRFNGVTAVNIARLNANGTVDTGFTTGTGLDGGATFVKVLPSGKILVSGGKAYRGTALNMSLGRLNPDGSLDGTFSGPVLDFGGSMSGVFVQPDGKIVGAAGYLNSSFRLVTQVIRMNENGALDPSFTRGTLSAGTVGRTVVQPSGKVVVGGVGFSQYGGVSVANLFRLHADGTLDTSFDASAVGKGLVNAMVTDAEGRLILYRAIGADVVCMRLRVDGARDTGFELPAGYGTYGFQVQVDGKILVSGNRIQGFAPVYGVYRLNGGGAAVVNPPVVTVQPVSQNLTVGGAAVMTVAATGPEPLTYQWKKDDRDISGATSASYGIPKVTLADAGRYTVEIRNGGGAVTSAAAVLTVSAAPEVPTVASIRFVVAGGTSLSLEWPTGYALQGTDALLPPRWVDVVGTSPLTVPTSGAGRFFRLIKR